MWGRPRVHRSGFGVSSGLWIAMFRVPRFAAAGFRFQGVLRFRVQCGGCCLILAMFAKVSHSVRHTFQTWLSNPQAITTALEEEAAEMV